MKVNTFNVACMKADTFWQGYMKVNTLVISVTG